MGGREATLGQMTTVPRLWGHAFAGLYCQGWGVSKTMENMNQTKQNINSRQMWGEQLTVHWTFMLTLQWSGCLFSLPVENTQGLKF